MSAKLTVNDILDQLDEEILKHKDTAEKAIRFTDRRQAAVKAAALEEFKAEIGK